MDTFSWGFTSFHEKGLIEISQSRLKGLELGRLLSIWAICFLFPSDQSWTSHQFPSCLDYSHYFPLTLGRNQSPSALEICQHVPPLYTGKHKEDNAQCTVERKKEVGNDASNSLHLQKRKTYKFPIPIFIRQWAITSQSMVTSSLFTKKEI